MSVETKHSVAFERRRTIGALLNGTRKAYCV